MVKEKVLKFAADCIFASNNDNESKPGMAKSVTSFVIVGCQPNKQTQKLEDG